LFDASAPTGRISIILWGNIDAIEEEYSPPLLGTDGQGPHATAASTGTTPHKLTDHSKKRQILKSESESTTPGKDTYFLTLKM
jgi:hypothetical protein